MERSNETIAVGHSISMSERKSIYITGVQKIESFDEEEFLLETNLGYLVLKGEGLQILKLDTKDGILSIKGLIISMTYIDDLKKTKNKTSMFEKLFK